MIRKLVLILVILAMTAIPLPALARDRGHEGRHEFHDEHERFEHSRAFVYSYPYYGSACYWQPGYWVNQLYADGSGGYTYVPQWVPTQYVCY